jgi:hypothetical protein
MRVDDRSGSKADLTTPKSNFRSTPVNGHRRAAPACPFRAATKPTTSNVHPTDRMGGGGGLHVGGGGPTK